MEIKLEETARGTRILYGESASKRRKVINAFANMMDGLRFQEVVLPIIEPASVYVDKAGPEVLGQMYVFPDKKDRPLCLRPEGTATCQLLARTLFKDDKDVRIFYVTNCYRYERPQLGRYREFLQFGVEILNPTDPAKTLELLTEHAINMVNAVTGVDRYTVNKSAKRGLAYYVGDGFEISCDELGAQKQVCGGGTYAEGVGFAIGIDRLMLMYPKE